MQATTHHRHVQLGRPGTWIAVLVLAVSLALAVAGGLALTGNLPGQGDAAVTDSAVVAGGSSDAAVTDWWTRMRIDEGNWGGVLPVPDTLQQPVPSDAPVNDWGGVVPAQGTLPQSLPSIAPPRDWWTQMRIDENSWGADFNLGAGTPMVPPYNDRLGTGY